MENLNDIFEACKLIKNYSDIFSRDTFSNIQEKISSRTSGAKEYEHIVQYLIETRSSDISNMSPKELSLVVDILQQGFGIEYYYSTAQKRIIDEVSNINRKNPTEYISSYAEVTNAICEGAYNHFVSDIDLTLSYIASYDTVHILYLYYIKNTTEYSLKLLEHIIHLYIDNVLGNEALYLAIATGKDIKSICNINKQQDIKENNIIIDKISSYYKNIKPLNTENIKLDSVPVFVSFGETFDPEKMFFNEVEQFINHTGVNFPENFRSLKTAETFIKNGCKNDEFLETYKKEREYTTSIIFSEEQSKKQYIFSKLYKLGLCCEVLAILTSIQKNEVSNSAESLYVELNTYLFVDTKNELTDYYKKSISDAQENKILREQNVIYEEYLEELAGILSKDILNENKVAKIRTTTIQRLKSAGILERTCETINDINESIIKILTEQTPYKTEIFKTEMDDKFKDALSELERRINLYYKTNKLNRKINIEGFIKILATAEYLYKEYVADGKMSSADYSFIAICYYNSLENILNETLYIPYYYKNLRKGTKNEEYYVLSKNINYLKKKGKYKQSLEIGVLCNLYIDPPPGLVEYINDISIKKESLIQLLKKIKNIVILRNEAAHGGIPLKKTRAKKAQDVTYIHTPHKDKDCKYFGEYSKTNNCHKEIIEFVELFPVN